MLQKALITFMLLFASWKPSPTGSLYAAPIAVPHEQYYHNAAKMRDHPGYYPFISYLDFRNLCEHIIDQSSELFDPESVKQGDLVYVNLWYIEWFQEKVHDHIKHPYILVSGDVGAFEPPRSIKKLVHDPKVAAWFCRNMAFSYHPKLFQIPFGQDLTPFDASIPVKNMLIAANLKGTLPKQHLLYMSHYPRSFGDRDKIVKIFEHEPYCFSRNHSDREWTHTPRPIFYEDLLSSKFVISPIGLEADCVRTWEAFVLDCIPIVEHSFLDPLYEGLPIVKVHEWTGITSQFLEQKYQELNKLPRNKAYFDYWIPIVRGIQKKVKENDLSFSMLDATQFNKVDLGDLKELLKWAMLNSKKTTKSRKQKDILFYNGALTTIRPLQIAELPSISQIYVHDYWLNHETFKDFNKYVTNKSILKETPKISVIESENEFENQLKSHRSAPVFLDLSYFRTSLKAQAHNFRHHLNQDLQNLLAKRAKGAFICGNMADNEYVRETLENFARITHHEIKRKGVFWYLLKK